MYGAPHTRSLYNRQRSTMNSAGVPYQQRPRPRQETPYSQPLPQQQSQQPPYSQSPSQQQWQMPVTPQPPVQPRTPPKKSLGKRRIRRGLRYRTHNPADFGERHLYYAGRRLLRPKHRELRSLRPTHTESFRGREHFFWSDADRGCRFARAGQHLYLRRPCQRRNRLHNGDRRRRSQPANPPLQSERGAAK